MKRVEWLTLAALPRYRPGDDARGARRGRVHRLLRPVSVLAVLRLTTLIQSDARLPLTGALALASLCCIHCDIHFRHCSMWSAVIGATLAWECTASVMLTIFAAAAAATWPSFPSKRCSRYGVLQHLLTAKLDSHTCALQGQPWTGRSASGAVGHITNPSRERCRQAGRATAGCSIR
jgi:hypothetical protein